MDPKGTMLSEINTIKLTYHLYVEPKKIIVFVLWICHEDLIIFVQHLDCYKC